VVSRPDSKKTRNVPFFKSLSGQGNALHHVRFSLILVMNLMTGYELGVY